jgi:DNA-binding CsgD family transcriptional regulator/PAS domain-containing protein
VASIRQVPYGGDRGIPRSGDTIPALSQSDLHGMLDFVREAESFPDVPSFRTGVLPSLKRLVPCDLVGYNEVDPEGGTTLVITHPEGVLFDGVEDTLDRLAHQHPIIARNGQGDFGTYAISDFLSRREYHGLELYDEIYGRIDAEDQIAFGLPGRVIVGIAMNRDRRTFSERDRELLDTLRPHLSQAWRHVQARGRAHELLHALEEGLEAAGGAVVILDSNGRIADAGGPARDLLEAYFGRRGELPLELSDWVESDPGTRPLVVDGPRGRLVVRLLDAVLVDRQPVLMLEESRRLVPSPEGLRSLGLTRREAEVLQLVAMGKENAVIAAELGIAEGTVRKHLERVYPKLGVSSRVAAVAKALGA